jgi:hypothetical protein
MQGVLCDELRQLSGKMDMVLRAALPSLSNGCEDSSCHKGQDQIGNRASASSPYTIANPGKMESTPELKNTVQIGVSLGTSGPSGTVNADTALQESTLHSKLQDAAALQQQSSQSAVSGALGWVTWMEDGSVSCCARR